MPLYTNAICSRENFCIEKSPLSCYTGKRIQVTVQDGGKTGAKTGVKFAYKHDFAPVFPSDGDPIFLSGLGRARRCIVLTNTEAEEDLC